MKNYIESVDWEKEYDKDLLYGIERQKDLENSWQIDCAKIEIIKPKNYEIRIKSRSFRRTYKKIIQFRSHLSPELIEQKL